MSIIQSVILGIVQGITEFLPISSSGHLILMPKFFNWTDQGLAFDAIMHLATGLAIIFALRKDIWRIFKGFNLRQSENENRSDRSDRADKRLTGLIILAIIPAGIIGFLFNDLIENSLRSVQVVAISLIFWGLILWFAEYYNNKLKDKNNLSELNWKQSLTVGLMQVVALIPGTSRSGITITGGLFSGMDRKTAVKFSFLVGLPLILGAGLLKFFELFKSGELAEQAVILSAGFISALISGFFAIKLLLWVADKASFKVFVVYRILLGLALLLLI